MNIIANADKNWAIGKDGALLFPIDADLKNFKRLTLNKIVVMGRKTLESLPGSKPLKDRRNIVLSKTLPETEGLHVCRSLASLQQLLSTQEFTNLTSDDVFVIGGAAVYAQLLPFCTTAYITKVEAEAQNPDAFFPNLDEMPEWRIAAVSELFQDKVPYRFVTYRRQQPDTTGTSGETSTAKAIERISKMERIFDKATAMLDKLEPSIAEYEALLPEIKQLEAYYAGRQWKNDLELDEAGKLPPDLKRGVLSEDGIYNMLERNGELFERICKIHFGRR